MLDLEDFIVSNNLLPFGSLIYLLFCTYKIGWGFDNFLAEANTGKGMKFPRWMKGYVKYILPLIVIVIFVMGYITKIYLNFRTDRVIFSKLTWSVLKNDPVEI